MYGNAQYGENREMQFSRGASRSIRLFDDPTTSEFDRERLPGLSGAVAVIKVQSSWNSTRRETVIMTPPSLKKGMNSF
jgi:hypothetical protein